MTAPAAIAEAAAEIAAIRALVAAIRERRGPSWARDDIDAIADRAELAHYALVAAAYTTA